MRDWSLSDSFKRIAQLNLAGAGQIDVRGDYAYVGHMKAPHGTSIVDISDRKNPVVVGEIRLPDDLSHSHKVRAFGDDLIIVNCERANRHLIRKIESALARQEGDPGLSDQAVASAMGLTQEELQRGKALVSNGYDQGGWYIYDVSDVSNPRLLTAVPTYGLGVHRFDVDDHHAYMSTEMEGFLGNILVTYDLGNPDSPEEVSRWWMPGQNLEAGEQPFWHQDEHRLHHALRFGNEMWAACWHGGYWRVDVSDMSVPKTAANYSTNPPLIEPAHTFMPLDERIDGRRIAVGIDEQHAQIKGQPPAGLWIFDVTDPNRIDPVSVFILSELDCVHARQGGRFGAHQFHEKPLGTLIFATWFSGGVRIIDLAHPEQPKEVAAYLPEPVGQNPTPQSNDIFVEDNGLIHIVDRFNGYEIVEFDGFS